jgi:hypothetical protein
VELLHLVPDATTANWDAALVVERIELETLVANAAWRQREFDQMREVPLVLVASDLALAAAHAGGPLMLCLRQFAFPHDALMLFACTLDAIFELAPIVRELLGHGVGSARHIATDCRPDVHGLTNLKFMRRHRYVGTSFICLRAIAANIPELFRSPDKPPLAELPFFVGC